MMDVVNLTKRKIPDLPWREIKEKILGKKYNLSLVLASEELLRDLNKKYRKKNTVPNTLSFSYSEKDGEVFLNIKEKPEKLSALFIHSLLHLKGREHGKEMEKEEKDWHNKIKLQ